MMFKPGVSLEGISPQMLIVAGTVEKIYLRHGCQCTITSALDGKHKEGSFHYVGRALDFRTRDIPRNLLPLIVDQIRQELGAEYDVILEETHLHIEHDPKG